MLLYFLIQLDEIIRELTDASLVRNTTSESITEMTYYTKIYYYSVSCH